MLALLAFGLALNQPAVIDGDTLRDAGGERYRVENIDAPERGGRADCAEERVLAEAARAYVEAWIAQSRRVEIDGVDLGERLIARGLAQPWRGRKANFCAGAWLLPAAR
jgi:micrococcal nuclease